VILGGGLAGLTAAYYLRDVGIIPSIYEAQSRIGGRVHTKKPFNKDGMFLDLGGEFIDPAHYELVALATDLGIEIEEYFDINLPLQPEIYVFDGNIIDQDRLTPEFRTFAPTAGGEAGFTDRRPTRPLTTT
jgi:monoamine oxidase